MSRADGLGEREVGARRLIESTMRESHGRALSVLIAQLGDFDLAEEAIQDAWIDAMRAWPRDGAPDNPVGWIVTAARRRAIDRLRQRGRIADLTERVGDELAVQRSGAQLDGVEWDSDDEIPDERLKLLFTCCHPALAAEARVALTLRTICGLTTREIARAFGVRESTMQQRIVRSKQRIATAAIPYRVPERDELGERLASVHSAIYVLFSEGFAATSDPRFVRVDLIAEAIRLARILCNLLPDEPESTGLLALCLLHDARRTGRVSHDGTLVLLADQDRASWNHGEITEGVALIERAGRARRPGPLQIQAAIAALHATAESEETTDWVQIVALYDQLIAVWPAPAARLARAVALGMADGADAGLGALDALSDEFDDDHRWHAAVGHMHERLRQPVPAAESFERAADLALHPLEVDRLRMRARDATG